MTCVHATHRALILPPMRSLQCGARPALDGRQIARIRPPVASRMVKHGVVAFESAVAPMAFPARLIGFRKRAFRLSQIGPPQPMRETGTALTHRSQADQRCGS